MIIARLAFAVAATLLIGAAAKGAPAVPKPLQADETLELELVLNGNATGEIGEFVLHDGRLFARTDELRDLGFRVPKTISQKPNGLVALSALPGVSGRLDEATQTLYVTATNSSLFPTLLQAGGPTNGSYHYESGTGITLNYDMTGNSVAGHNDANGSFDFRAFSPYGVTASGFLGYVGGSPNGAGTSDVIRLDSNYVYSDTTTLRQISVGDSISGGLDWTRPVRFGGIQIASNFSLRPDLITFPVPSLSGSAAVPSTVDVLVNGTTLLSTQVKPGPFQIPQMPVVTGAGTIAMTVTNALGRQTTAVLPFYASSSLLAPGLQAYSVEFGAIRDNWGVVSNDYNALAGSGTYRRGLSSYVTVDTHAEGTPGVFMAGGGILINVDNLGVVNFAGAGSTGVGGAGEQASVGIQRLGRVFSLGGSVTLASRNFSDIAARNGDPVAQRQINANTGISLGRFGSLGVAYAGIDRDVAPEPVSFFVPAGSALPQNAGSSAGQFVSFFPAQHTHLLTTSYSLSIYRMALYATGFHDFSSGGGGGVLFGITVPLGSRSSASATVNTDNTGTSADFQAMQTPEKIGDWGYHIDGGPGSPNHEFADLQYMSRWTMVSAGVDRTGPQTTYQAETQGALSYVDDAVFVSNTINDSYAIVDTNGVKGIHVLNENRPVGVTDATGLLLVPNLRSFEANHVEIDPTDIPVDATLPFFSTQIRPLDRSGVVVHFPVRITHSALLTLVDETGRPLPIGSTATLATTGTVVPIGYDGEAFVQDLTRGNNQLTVERPNGLSCSAIFNYHVLPGEIPQIGPIRCKNNKP